jgi:hypothetical protein
MRKAIVRTEKVPGTGKRSGLFNYRLTAVDGMNNLIYWHKRLLREYEIVKVRNILCERLSDEYDEVTTGGTI